VLKFIVYCLQNRLLIFTLAKRNFKGGYVDSYFGIFWALVEPAVYAFLLWMFFTKAMKFEPPNGYPFVPWLLSSLILWNFFSLAVTSFTSVFRSHSFLLNGRGFDFGVLPLISIITALLFHMIFLFVLAVVCYISQVHFSLYWFQSIYYLLATCFLLLGIGWVLASVSVFSKDISFFVGVLLQVGFWVSPIFWSVDTYPEKFHYLLELNPLTYVMEGYRNSFIYGVPFWRDLGGALYFWGFSSLALLIGRVVYHRIRPHIGDFL
jgi:ABC-type polysaccharide/polyol phosphate export permease